MLTTLRQNFHNLKWILWAVIAVFVLFVFVDWGMGSAGRRGDEDPTWIARVGSNAIPAAEFQREYRDAEERQRQMFGKNFTPELLKMMNLPDQVLNSLIDRRLLRAEADRLNLKVTDAELTAKVLGFKDGQGRPLFLRDGVFVGESQYRRSARGGRLRPRELRGLRPRAGSPREAEPVLHRRDLRLGPGGRGRLFRPEREGEDRIRPPPPAAGGAGRGPGRGSRGVLQAEPDALPRAGAAEGEVPPRRVRESEERPHGHRRRRAEGVQRQRRLVPQGRGGQGPPHPLQGRGDERRRGAREGRGGREEAEGRRRLRRAREGRVRRPGLQGERRRARELRPRPDGEGVRGRRLRRGPEADRRAGQERLRLPRHPGRGEDRAPCPASLRGGAGDPLPPPRPAGRRRGATPGARAGREGREAGRQALRRGPPEARDRERDVQRDGVALALRRPRRHRPEPGLLGPRSSR